MIIPRYWAEARLQDRETGRQITVRRFGWSNVSQDDAQVQANSRATAALERLKSGEKLIRRELKRAYNGSDGVPIREEVISRHKDAVITRNSYGARCLNTPNVLFVDVDLATEPGCGTILVVLLALWVAAAIAGWQVGSKAMGFSLGFGALFMFYPLSQLVIRWYLKMNGGAERIARRRVEKFVARNRDWGLRVYRTPAGLRILATHDLFQPGDPAVTRCFKELRADPLYTRMCVNQQCFRARISPKPWRIGITDHIRRGVWPVPTDQLETRSQWVAKYEAASTGFAACTYLESLGSGAIHTDARFVQELHDDLCQALTSLPIA